MIKLARELAPEGYGMYSVVIAIVSIFVVGANLGMSQVVIREVARKPNATACLFFKVLGVRLLSTLVTIIGICLYFLFFAPQMDKLLIATAVLITISLTGWDLAESLAFGRQVMKYSASVNICAMVIWTATIWMLPKSLFSLVDILMLYTGINIGKTFIYYFILVKQDYFSQSDHLEVADRKTLVKMSLPYLWLWGIGAIGNQIPILFLAENSGAEQVGLFSVGARLVIPLTLVVGTATRAIFPILCQQSVSNPEKFQRTISDGAVLIALGGTIAAFALSMFSPYYIPFLFGDRYLPSIDAFNLLIWFGVVYALDGLLGAALSSSDRQNLLAILATVDILLAFPILYYGSFRGAYGLAMAKLVLGFIVALYHWVIFKKVIGKNFRVATWVLLGTYFFSVAIISTFHVFSSTALIFTFFVLITVILYIVPTGPFREIPIIIRSNLRRNMP
jgi:O-antigen/teichoic acid export membrane protein